MKKTCSNCHKEFRLIKQELAFYKKMGLPKPDHCPDCRLKRRLSLRNERKFYKYPCSNCKKDMITTINPDKKLTVFCLDCYRNFRANVDLTKV